METTNISINEKKYIFLSILNSLLATCPATEIAPWKHPPTSSVEMAFVELCSNIVVYGGKPVNSSVQKLRDIALGFYGLFRIRSKKDDILC